MPFILGRRTQLRASCALAATLWRISQEMHRVFREPEVVCVKGETGMDGHSAQVPTLHTSVIDCV